MENTYQNTFRRLAVWQRAKELTLEVYKIVNQFPKTEQYALASQIRRAAASIVANIAEGNTRKTKRDRQNFLGIAHGSLVELDCFLELALDLGYIGKEDYNKLIEILNKTAYLLLRFRNSQADE